jgi:phosphoribosyl 1,2-cyclic phosphodiesterase
MNIRFWGVRGSLPTPLTPEQVKLKISSVVQKISAKDIETPEARDAFLASLPAWLYGTVGGNTPCLEVTGENGTKLIFDAGTGIRVMGKDGVPPADSHYNLIFSHFHWDHIQGLPFFGQAYNPAMSFDVYSPFADMESYLRKQMVPPYYPVTFDAFTKNFNFHTVEPLEKFRIGEFNISCVEMSHPGKSYSYLVEENGKKFVYATDIELTPKDFVHTQNMESIFSEADVLVRDSQYTVEEALRKENWGHSAFCYAIDFATTWRAKKVYLFHHEPTYDDRKLNAILESANWYAKYIGHEELEIYIATEDKDIKL